MSARIIEHQNYRRGLVDLRSAVAASPPGKIVWLIAPSGSGKSEIRYSLMRELSGNPASWPSGHLPAITVRAALTDRNKFNPKDLALRLNLAMRQPDLSWLTPRGQVPDPDTVHFQSEAIAVSERWNQLRMSLSEHALRSEFERTAKVRGLKWIFLEEVASLLQLHLHQSSTNYMTGLMQLVEEIGCVLIMVGTHHAAPLWEDNREVINRSSWAWIRRYDPRNPDDHVPFAAMVKALGKRFPLETEDLISSNLELLLLNGAGVFGSTLQYLMKADNERARVGSPHIALKHLHAASATKEEQLALWHYVEAFDDLSTPKPNLELGMVTKTIWRGKR